MKTPIYPRLRFHPDVIKRSNWLYFRFNLSFRDVEELMIERGVDDEGTVLLDVVVQRQRNTRAATRLLRKRLRNQGLRPTRIVTDRRASYGSALKLLYLKHLQDVREECPLQISGHYRRAKSTP